MSVSASSQQLTLSPDEAQCYTSDCVLELSSYMHSVCCFLCLKDLGVTAVSGMQVSGAPHHQRGALLPLLCWLPPCYLPGLPPGHCVSLLACRHGHACPHALTLHWMATYLKMLVTPLSHVICGPCLQTMHFGCRPTGNDGLTSCMHTITHVSCILDDAWCTSYADQFLFGTAACYVAMQV